MDHVTCVRCQEDVVPKPPRRGFWAMVVSFWVFSLLFGIGTVLTQWGFVFVVAWLALACAMGLLARSARSWTCPVCGNRMAPPVPRQAPEQTGVRARGLHAKRA